MKRGNRESENHPMRDSTRVRDARAPPEIVRVRNKPGRAGIGVVAALPKVWQRLPIRWPTSQTQNLPDAPAPVRGATTPCRLRAPRDVSLRRRPLPGAAAGRPDPDCKAPSIHPALTITPAPDK